MKYLELTEEKAKQLNELCKFAAEFGINQPFDITYYQRQNPQFDLNYYFHLIDIALQYENVNKLIDVSLRTTIHATHNTKEFLKGGGFLRIMKIEQRENKIQDYTVRNLRQSIFATKHWWVFFVFSTLITLIVSFTTTLSSDRLSQKNSPPTTIQDSLLRSLTTYILRQDSQTVSYHDSLHKVKK